MNSDFYLNYEISDTAHIDLCVNGRGEFSGITDWYSRCKLLADCIANDPLKKYARSGNKVNDPKGHKAIILYKYNKLIEDQITNLKTLGIYSPAINIEYLPQFSFFIQFCFQLETPYLSRDDEEFYICENPIKKDKVFKVPMVSASTWKGVLRSVAERSCLPDQLIYLFGNERNESEDFKKGRLHFYPTFFNKIGLEVINPHDRKSKAGTNPILLECVPAENSVGVFSMLYVPFDLLGESPTNVFDAMLDDIKCLGSILMDTFRKYGFGAKTGSGFGIAKSSFDKDGVLTINIPDLTLKSPITELKFSNFSKLKKAIDSLDRVRGKEKK